MRRQHRHLPAGVQLRHVRLVLGVERGSWLGEVVDAGHDGGDLTRYLVDLELRVSESAPRIAFRKAAYVDVGQLVTLGGPLALVREGKRVSVGAPGSGTEVNAQTLLEANGISFDDFTAERLNFNETADALANIQAPPRLR